jgi:hypothetical protein
MGLSVIFDLLPASVPLPRRCRVILGSFDNSEKSRRTLESCDVRVWHLCDMPTSPGSMFPLFGARFGCHHARERTGGPPCAGVSRSARCLLRGR